MKPRCDRCQQYYDGGMRYCGICGYRFPNKKGELTALEKIMLLATAIIIVLLLVETVVLLLNVSTVLSFIGTFGVNISIIIPTSVRLLTLHGVLAQAYWLVIILAILASVSYTIYGVLSNLKYEPADVYENTKKSAAYWVTVLFCADMFVQVALILIAASMGLEINTGWMDEYTDQQMLYLLADASVWEEIISRVMYIGVPIFLIQLVRTKRPNTFRMLLGGFGMSKISLILIVFSGIMFGMAHYNGWGMTKAVITCIGGIIMGYVYVRFGLYASITMHFVTDYLSGLTYVGLASVSIIFELTLIGIGLIACIYLFTKVSNKEDTIKIVDELPLFPKM